MSTGSAAPWIPTNFLALPPEQSDLASSRVVLIPIPYDSSTSYRAGAREGPMAILRASYNLEDYDHELDYDVSQVGIHTTPLLEPHMGGPRLMVERIRETVLALAGDHRDEHRIIGVLGGEHTVSIGAVQALASRHRDMSVLYLDAHGDLRNEYMSTPWGHASVARRLLETCPVVQVGVRSLCEEEAGFIRRGGAATFLWDPEEPRLPDLDELLSRLTPEVYVSIDLDALDPSIMAAVGTPEPGGMSWGQMTGLLRRVAAHRRIVGFDVTELSPEDGPPSCSYLAAKLVYKLIAFSTLERSKAGLAAAAAGARRG